jgi:transcriptional regulator with XRE-family HTH domain
MSDTYTLSERVAEEIRAMLGRKRMSGRQLATKLGVSQTWMSTRLSGTTPIDLNDLEKIARVLDVEVTDLLPRSGGGLITTASPQADHQTRTNARSPRLTGRPTLTGQPKRASERESTRRPARTIPVIAELMPDDLIAELVDSRAV